MGLWRNKKDNGVKKRQKEKIHRIEPKTTYKELLTMD